MKAILILITLLIACLVARKVLMHQRPILNQTKEFVQHKLPLRSVKHKPGVNVLKYRNLQSDLAAARLSLKADYLQAADESEKRQILNRCNHLVFNYLVDSLIPFWYGTPWDYNGTSQTPGSGHIACGYFVSTTLRDAGFNLPRVKMAQQASEIAIRSLLADQPLSRLSNSPMSKFVAQVNRSGDGLYVVGLDNHIGFLYKNGDKQHFIHSSYDYPGGVQKENVWRSPLLTSSRYRVYGKLTGDEKLLKKWLMNEPIHVG